MAPVCYRNQVGVLPSCLCSLSGVKAARKACTTEKRQGMRLTAVRADVVKVLNSHGLLCSFLTSELRAQIFRGLPWNLSKVLKRAYTPWLPVTDLAPVVTVMWCPGTRNPRDDRHRGSTLLHPCHTPRNEAAGKGSQEGHTDAMHPADCCLHHGPRSLVSRCEDICLTLSGM
jgi:hypothetical protein